MFEFLALLFSGVFSGAAVYISIVQHPAALQVGGSFPGRFFPPMYQKAAPMQAGLAVLGSISGLIAGLSGSGLAWLLGAVLLFSVVPFTLIRIKPLNDQLLDPSRDLEAPDTLALLQQWGRLHWARSASGGVAFLLFLLG